MGDELAARLTTVALILPGFRYEAVMDNGVRENELCPVFRARIAGELSPDPAEVTDVAWVRWDRFAAAVAMGIIWATRIA